MGGLRPLAPSTAASPDICERRVTSGMWAGAPVHRQRAPPLRAGVLVERAGDRSLTRAETCIRSARRETHGEQLAEKRGARQTAGLRTATTREPSGSPRCRSARPGNLDSAVAGASGDFHAAIRAR
jgi:hypothetical protein